MSASAIDTVVTLPDPDLTRREATLLGFGARYDRVRDRLRMLLRRDGLAEWNRQHHGGQLALVDLMAEQYPLVVFHGDPGTGKTSMAECIANRLAQELPGSPAVLLRLSVVRAYAPVHGTLVNQISAALAEVAERAAQGEQAILLLDEADAAAAPASGPMTPEANAAALALVEGAERLRKYEGRVLVIVCVRRSLPLHPGVIRRTAVLEHFARPGPRELLELFQMDLAALGLSRMQLNELVERTRGTDGSDGWTYADIRRRLYPAALARAFPTRPLALADLLACVDAMEPSP